MNGWACLPDGIVGHLLQKFFEPGLLFLSSLALLFVFCNNDDSRSHRRMVTIVDQNNLLLLLTRSCCFVGRNSRILAVAAFCKSSFKFSVETSKALEVTGGGWRGRQG